MIKSPFENNKNGGNGIIYIYMKYLKNGILHTWIYGAFVFIRSRRRDSSS